MSKEDERKEMLKKDGYFTVNILIQKLQELKDQGYGDELVCDMEGHISFCGYDSFDDCISIL